MAKKGPKLTGKEKREIRKKRRALRKDLRKKGIKSREEFEIIAHQMGLTYGDSSKALIVPWWAQLGGFLSALGLKGLLGGIVLALMGLGALFLYASLYNQKGNFTVAVSGDLLNIGFDLSATEDFESPKVRLTSDVLHEVNAMSVQDLPDNLDKIEGSHNLDNVVAYTFWIRNAGEETVDYDWHLILNAVTKNLDDSVWLMIYDEGYQTIYAKPIAETDEPEHLSGYVKPPLYDQAADPDKQYYQTDEGTWGIMTTPYVEERIVAQGTEVEFEPGEKHKYTVVIWVEGDDPECTNEILGAHAGFAMKYTIAGDDESIFDDLIFDDLEPELVDTEIIQIQ